MKNSLCVIIVLTTLTSCIFRSSKDYFYIRPLSEPGLEVVLIEKPSFPQIKLSEEMPTLYQYDRKNYQILLRSDFTDYWPSILVAAVDSGGKAMSVVPLIFEYCGSFSQYLSVYEIDSIPAKRYVWRPALNRNCPVPDRDSLPLAQFIHFDVHDSNGVLVDTVSIGFELIKNGKFISIDAP